MALTSAVSFGLNTHTFKHCNAIIIIVVIITITMLLNLFL
jgi:hypothetical protein